MTHILIIGSGMAAMAAAHELLTEKTLITCTKQITVLDKARGAGGRISARRYADSHFTHGAQFATAQDDSFRLWCSELQAVGRADVWNPKKRTNDRKWWVGTPRMSALTKHPSLDGLEILYKTRISEIISVGEQWSVLCETEDGEKTLGPFTHVIATAPIKQTIGIMPQGSFRNQIQSLSVLYDPCWTVMIDFKSRVETESDIFRPQNPSGDEVLGWAAREASRPGGASGERWTLQAGPKWSHQNYEKPAEFVVSALTAAFQAMVGPPLPQIAHTGHQRWRYARVSTPAGNACYVNETGTLALAGDWCLGPRIEAAFLSGKAAAASLRRS